jgi:hypothetical protein
MLLIILTTESRSEEPEAVKLMKHGHEKNPVLCTQRYMSSPRGRSGQPFDLGFWKV